MSNGLDQDTTIDLSGVSTTMEALEKGYYPIQVEEAPEKRNTDGDPEKPYYAWIFTITSPEDVAGRKLYHNTSLQAQSVWSFRQVLEALGWSPEDLNKGPIKFEPEDAVGTEGVAYVVPDEWPKGTGQMRNRVRRMVAAGAEIAGGQTLL